MRLSEELSFSARAGPAIPAEILIAVDWLEDKGAVRSFTASSGKAEHRFATLYPESASVPAQRQSLVSFQLFEDFYYDYAAASSDVVKARLSLFVRTGGGRLPRRRVA